MASRLVLMPGLPGATMWGAENFFGSGVFARAAKMAFGVSQATPAAVAERTRNSRRCMSPPIDPVAHRCSQATPNPCPDASQTAIGWTRQPANRLCRKMVSQHPHPLFAKNAKEGWTTREVHL